MTDTTVKSLTQRIPLFSNASEYSCWISSNCENCSKYRPHASDDDEFVCDIDRAISLAACDDGTVSVQISRRMGMDEAESYGWQWKQQCPEFNQVYSWYCVGVEGEKKGLLIGPLESEADAIAKVPLARLGLKRLAEDRPLMVDPDTLQIDVEHLPTNDSGHLTHLSFFRPGLLEPDEK